MKKIFKNFSCLFGFHRFKHKEDMFSRYGHIKQCTNCGYTKGIKPMIDMTQVGAIHQDFSKLKLRVVNKQNHCLWEKTYTDREVFNLASKELMISFDVELEKRDKQGIR